MIKIRMWTPKIAIESTIDRAVEVFGVEREHITGKVRRTGPATRARFAAVWAIRTANQATYSAIARYLKRDHSSMIYAVERCAFLQQRDMGYRRACERLLESVR